MESRAFVSWEEVLISNEKGRREVHYYLKRADGGSDLAVVGKERSLRHMSYVVPNLFLRSLRPSSPLKWRSRREVVDWLSSLVTGNCCFFVIYFFSDLVLFCFLGAFGDLEFVSFIFLRFLFGSERKLASLAAFVIFVDGRFFG